MGFLHTPIDVEGTLLCIDHALEDNLGRITDPVLLGEPAHIETYGVHHYWEGFANGVIQFGSGYFMDVTKFIWSVMNGGASGVAFGLGCGASQIVLRLYGGMRVLLPGQDDVHVYLNGAEVWATAADTTAGQDYWNTVYGIPATTDEHEYPYYEGSPGSPQLYHDLTIPLTAQACGNVITIMCGEDTTDWPGSHPSAWWAHIVSIS